MPYAIFMDFYLWPAVLLYTDMKVGNVDARLVPAGKLS